MNLQVLSYDLGGIPSFKFFRIEDVNPVSGRTKQRRLGAPNKAMQLLQKRLVKVIRSPENHEVCRKLLRYATSSNVGNSPDKNVEPHRGNRYFYLTDFSNALDEDLNISNAWGIVFSWIGELNRKMADNSLDSAGAAAAVAAWIRMDQVLGVGVKSEADVPAEAVGLAALGFALGAGFGLGFSLAGLALFGRKLLVEKPLHELL